MHVRIGDDAPRFDLESIDGTRIRLEDYAGKKLLLAFMRFAGCPLCNLRTDQLVQFYPIWQSKGLEVIVFIHSPPETLRRYADRHTPPFPVIGDPHGEVYQKYGVDRSALRALVASGPWHPKAMQAMFKGYMPGTRSDGAASLIPADFLIGPDLKIHTAYYGKSAADHLPMRRIVEFADTPLAAATT
jgi:peroxiredoxin